MTEDEALEAAKRIAKQRGWIGFKPVRASVERRWIVHFDEYVDASADGRGNSGSIEIDEATGQLIFAEFRMEVEYPGTPEHFQQQMNKLARRPQPPGDAPPAPGI